jgi:hypothetical protein
MTEKTNSHRNITLTRFHPSCRLCHYAGFSNICAFSQTGECAYNIPNDGILNEDAEQNDK